MEEREYTFLQNESCMGFLQRTLGGKVNANIIKEIDILLEIIIPEISDSDYSLTISHQAAEIGITISHSGKAIKEDLMGIVDDRVDSLRYRHLSKDRHTLKIRKKTIRKELYE